MAENLGLGPKAESKRIKAKGLQKLIWYCQMCEKQCRDANGFKCHCLSESHQRQMQIFGQNQGLFIEKYSQEFEDAFLDHMRRCHRFGRVLANVVYNEYISDRHHVHMNGTKWATLMEFVMYLGKTGKCKVEDTARGWFISYNVEDSEALFMERRRSKRLKATLVEEEKKEREILKQIERASELSGMEINEGKGESKHILGSENGGKIAFALSSSRGGVKGGGRESSKGVFENVESDEVDKNRLGRERLSKSFGGEIKSSRSALDDLMREEEEAKERRNRKPYWLCEGIVVKVISRTLEEKGYYKKKGIVRKVVDRYVGEIEMLDSKHIVQIHQDELETVIPQIGGLVRIVNGSYRGSNARLLAVDTYNFCAKLQLEKGIYEGRVLQEVTYEDICKLVVS